MYGWTQGPAPSVHQNSSTHESWVFRYPAPKSVRTSLFVDIWIMMLSSEPWRVCVCLHMRTCAVHLEDQRHAHENVSSDMQKLCWVTSTFAQQQKTSSSNYFLPTPPHTAPLLSHSYLRKLNLRAESNMFRRPAPKNAKNSGSPKFTGNLQSIVGVGGVTIHSFQNNTKLTDDALSPPRLAPLQPHFCQRPSLEYFSSLSLMADLVSRDWSEKTHSICNALQ